MKRGGLFYSPTAAAAAASRSGEAGDHHSANSKFTFSNTKSPL